MKIAPCPQDSCSSITSEAFRHSYLMLTLILSCEDLSNLQVTTYVEVSKVVF